MSDAENMSSLAIMRDGDQLKTQAEASASERISKAPRAWGIKTSAGIDPDAVSAPEHVETLTIWAQELFPDGFKLVPIALVELKPEERE